MRTNPVSGQSSRLQFLDAARGATMFFVLLAHFGQLFFRLPQHADWRIALTHIGMVATPTFLILSGLLLGVLYQTNRTGFAGTQAKLIDRGLFLVLIGHVIICVALMSGEHTFNWSLSTDAIGAAVVVGAILIPRTSGRRRLVLSLVGYVASWIAVYWWAPGSRHSEALKELTVGSLTPVVFEGTFPLVPWIAVYLASSVLGERLAALQRIGAGRRIARELACAGVGGIVLMVSVKLAGLWLGVSPLRHVSTPLLQVGHKYPPGPLYLLFYGGVGLLLVSGCLVVERRNIYGRARRYAAQCGEASFFIFIAHFYLYWLGIRRLGPGGPLPALLYFSLSTLVLFVLARLWFRGRCNRFLTVGYEALSRHWPVAPRVPARAPAVARHSGMKPRVIVHPILIGLYPAMFAYAHHIALAPRAAEVFMWLAISGCAAAILWGALALATGDSQKAAISVSLFIVMLFSYGQLTRLFVLPSWNLRIVSFSIGHIPVLALAWIAAAVAASRWLQRASRDATATVTLALNVAAVALVVLGTLSAGTTSHASSHEQQMRHRQLPLTERRHTTDHTAGNQPALRPSLIGHTAAEPDEHPARTVQSASAASGRTTTRSPAAKKTRAGARIPYQPGRKPSSSRSELGLPRHATSIHHVL